MTETKYTSLFGTRLRQARQMAGFSLRELSDRIGGAVSHNALAKYERGEMMPDGTLLIALSEALNQPPGFFFRPTEPAIQGVKYRAKHDTLGVKQFQTLEIKAQDYFERYLSIESILGLKHPFHNPLGKLRIESPQDAETAAEKLRDAWNLGRQPIGNLMEMLELNGIKVCEVDAPPEFDGFSGWIGSTPIVVIGKHLNDQCLTRKRHTTIHELGHVLLKDRLAPGLDEEKIVARFAGSFILPAESCRQAFGGFRETLSLKELISIKVTWGISLGSLMMRAKQQELITPALSRRFWDRYKAENWKAKEPGDDDYRGCERSQRFRQLVFRAVAEQQVTRSKAASLLNVTLVEIRKGDDLLS
ncbi:MAG: ImmA/IrrE family metallo-endopeptidase [Blastochloris sp.]|nr:ImmA/IrrE family metallo-endopeptidase [Blastochloris sp.]